MNSSRGRGRDDEPRPALLPESDGFDGILRELHNAAPVEVELEAPDGSVRTVTAVVRYDGDGPRLVEGTQTYWLTEGYAIRRFL